jgi:hypothetical protein
MSALGPLRRFAAMQQDVGNRGEADRRRTRPAQPRLILGLAFREMPAVKGRVDGRLLGDH